jgi:hypothetical protein
MKLIALALALVILLFALAACGSDRDRAVKATVNAAAITPTPTPNSNQEILMTLYESTNGDAWIGSSGWGTERDACTWYGIRCSARGVITGLGLQGNNLSGSIPPELGNLTKLEDLWLRDNELSGPIPPELGKLTNLRYLLLSGNNLSGSIPPKLIAVCERPTMIECRFDDQLKSVGQRSRNQY